MCDIDIYIYKRRPHFLQCEPITIDTIDINNIDTNIYRSLICSLVRTSQRITLIIPTGNQTYIIHIIWIGFSLFIEKLGNSRATTLHKS